MKLATQRQFADRYDKIYKTDKTKINVKLLKNNTLIINPQADNPDDTRIYKPSPTFEKFHDDDSFVRIIMGPYGSGKTTGCLIDSVINTIKMPECVDGVRRARLLVARNTYPELHSTTIPTWENWFGDLGNVRSRQKPYAEYFHTFNDENGKISLHVLFMAFEGPNDVKKLKSFEPTFALLEELSELHKTIFDHAKARVGRWPSEQICKKPFRKKVICPTNPPDESHWIYELMEIDQPEKHALYKQPPGLLKNKKGELIENPAAENIEHLNGGYEYYFDAAAGQTQEFIKVFIMGYYGMLKVGQVVYKDYNDDFHAVSDIDVDRNESLIATVDYGTVSPAILICQYVNSQLRVIKEFCGSFVTVKELWSFFALPWLQKYAANLGLEIYGDPANTYAGREQLQECGLIVSSAPTNKIDKRLSSVIDLLTRFVNGHPRLIISKKGCPKLREGFMKKYCYKELQTVAGTAYKDTPNKNHPYSDVHDCLQYQALLVSDGLADMNNDDDAYDEIRRHRINELKNKVTGY